MVTTCIALLRGINVGGRHSLPMARCREVVAAAGGTDVRTYIQSGNVVFEHDGGEPDIAERLAADLSAAAGFAVPVVLRRLEEWRTVADRCPFTDPDPTRIHIAFRPAVPSPDPIDAEDWSPFDPEQLAISGREVFLHLPEGIGRSKLATRLARVAPDITVRNLRTIDKITALAQPAD